MTDNRATLKSYFQKNAIPTSTQFSALIDAQLNRAEDGIFKDPNAPLGIIAEGLHPALRLFPSTNAPASGHWSLDLRAPTVPETPYHLGIVDGSANTRLFVHGTTGFVGLGTITPSVNLDVVGTTKTTALGVGTAPAGGLSMHVSGNAGVSGNLGLGTTTPAAKLDVVGTFQVSSNGWVLGSLGVGTNGIMGGVQLNVAGKAKCDALDVYGTAMISNSLVIGTDLSDPNITERLHVEGGGEFRASGTNFLRVTSDDDAILVVRSRERTPALNLTCGSDPVLGIQLLAESNEKLRLRTLNGEPLGVFVEGQVNADGLEGTTLTVVDAAVRGRMLVGEDPGNVSVTEVLHVFGGAEFRSSDASANTLSVKSAANNVLLKLVPANNCRSYVSFYLDAAATRGLSLMAEKALVNGVDGNVLSLGSIDGKPTRFDLGANVTASAFTGGGAAFTAGVSANSLSATTSVSATTFTATGSVNAAGSVSAGANGTISVGVWAFAVLNNALVISCSGVRYAALSNGTGGINRFEVRTSSGHFYLKSDGTFGHAVSPPTLL